MCRCRDVLRCAGGPRIAALPADMADEVIIRHRAKRLSVVNAAPMKVAHPQIFDRADRWLPVASGQSEGRLSVGRGALRFDFDFKGGRGFIVARRELSLEMPAEFVIRFRVRGSGPVNHFELKLADNSGKNVWRREWRDFQLRRRGRELRFANHEIEFAWGPAGGGEIGRVGAIEFAVVAGEGGAGTVWLSDLTIEDRSLRRAPAVSSSSAVKKPAADLVSITQWRPRASDTRPWLGIDLREPRLLGGMVIEWLDGAPAGGFRVRASNSGRAWKTLHAATKAGGARSYVWLPKTNARHLRLELSGNAGVRSLRWQGYEFSRSIEAFWRHIAAEEPRGWHPRWLMREQSLWTPVGIPNGRSCALINEEGMIEIGEGSFSIEPFVFADGRLFTWADVKPRQQLRDAWHPVPSVNWETNKWGLIIEAWASADGVLHVRYCAQNRTARPLHVRLFAAIRPFQVTPPWQHFRNVGGVSRIHELRWDGVAVHVNDSAVIVPDANRAAFGAMTSDEGTPCARLAGGAPPAAPRVREAFGFATGVLAFALELPPRGEDSAGWSTALVSAGVDPWQNKLPENQLRGASWAGEVIRSALTATAHILVTRNGPALQPGPRRYTRSWIRDGTIMSAALLRMGCADEVSEFIRWYAPHQREDGFVPCCVDRDGPDWLVEHDSHGQFIALIADYARFTNDIALMREMWPRICKAATFMARVIEPGGLLPISASHEGYLAQPVHSYWDDFWALRGLRDAAAVAEQLGQDEQADQWKATAGDLSAAIRASIETTRAEKNLDFIPGSVEWADFDPTATANAVTLFDAPPELNRDALMRTFDKYLTDWRKKRRGEMEWSNYSPYEIRIIGALVHLGRRDEALELLRFFLSDRRPLAWNQWPEIAWRDPRSPGHIGDVPHTWIGAEYVLAVQSLFAFESEALRAIVIGGGIAAEWMDDEGVRVQALPTSRGPLSYSLRRFADGLIFCDVSADIDLPAGGLILRPPLAEPMWRVTINDEVIEAHGSEEIRVDALPATITIHPLSHA